MQSVPWQNFGDAKTVLNVMVSPFLADFRKTWANRDHSSDIAMDAYRQVNPSIRTLRNGVKSAILKVRYDETMFEDIFRIQQIKNVQCTYAPYTSACDRIRKPVFHSHVSFSMLSQPTYTYHSVQTEHSIRGLFQGFTSWSVSRSSKINKNKVIAKG